MNKRIDERTRPDIIPDIIDRREIDEKDILQPIVEKKIDFKITNVKLAEKAGISRATLAKMRKDEPVNLDVIIKVTKALDCDKVGMLSIMPVE